MFFIIEGVIEKVADKIDDSENIQLTKGDFYGWEAMLGTVKNTENLVSVGFTTIESLQKQDFVNLMNLYPDFQKHVYQSLKENTMQSFNRVSIYKLY
jgi:signal-transduction protein with cAMP-binding, CBS, and nucleotidyltransferase domain